MFEIWSVLKIIFDFTFQNIMNATPPLCELPQNHIKPQNDKEKKTEMYF